MSELLAFIQLGFHHIVNPEAADHILFLLALAAIYRPRDWRNALWVVTAFTAGHSITLALAVTNALTLPTAWIEFLIPVTIVATGIENLVVRDRTRTLRGGRYRPVLSGVFGLVHGAGFANYLRSLFVTRVAIPLFGFNVGIELGQILVLAVAAVAFVAIDRVLEHVGRRVAGAALRWRVVGISAAVIAVATRWAAQRAPW
ncbi:MAG TPA: HupE/UreJ family protein [Gemmatimonadales bacterium]|nr:HupE/UreJ family protein [Gemmatimonadales bacterium]